MKRVLFQSLTTQLLFYAPCPVLIVPLAALIQWERIILAVNGSHSIEPALSEALKIAKEYGSHVTAAIAPRRGGPAAVKEASHQLKTSAEQAGVPLETVLLPVHAMDELCRLAKEQDADIIITTQPDESILKHIIHGSFSEQIIDRSLCSVLVIPGARDGVRTKRTIS